MTPIHSLAPHWRVVCFAVLVATGYVTWLRMFEQWLEPTVRRVAGRLIGRAIVWVPAVGPFRIWGLRDDEGSAADAVVGVSGYAVVIISALVPAALLHVASFRPPQEWILPASSYLASVVMSSLFLVRSLLGQSEVG
jgi:hypothetical protein